MSVVEKSATAAIGISGHQHGLVPLDAVEHALYNVKLWNDTSTTEECAIITKAAGGDGEVIAEVRNLMLPHDYLNYKFTGAYKADFGDASGTALFSAAARTWSAKMCAIIDEKLLALLPPADQSPRS